MIRIVTIILLFPDCRAWAETFEQGYSMTAVSMISASSARKLLLGALVGVTAVTAMPAQAQEEVNVYSYRQAYLIEPFLKEFTEETGVKVNVVFAKQGLAERLKREGRNTPADVLLTVDVGRLQELVDEELVKSVNDSVIEANLPAQYHGPDNQWFGITTRARVLYTSVDRLDAGQVSSYDDLADPSLKGRVCSRAGDHPYNVALIASRIAHNGEEATREWLEGFKDNLARKPQGGDRDQIKAIRDNVCDVAIGNSYYYGNMLNNEEQRPWAEKARIEFPDQNGVGTHMNISGMAMTKYAPHEENALKLMRFLTEKTAQHMYAEVNYEYPANPEAESSELLASWGEFKQDDLSLTDIAKYRKRAAQMVNEVGFNQ